MWKDEERTGRVGNRNRTEQEEEWKGSVIEKNSIFCGVNKI